MTHEESIAEARRILSAAGVADERIRIEGAHPNWLVAVRGFGAGATDATDETMNEPHEVAAALVAAMRPLAPAREAEDAGGHETHGETGEDAEEADASAELARGGVDALSAGDVRESDQRDGNVEGASIDADFSLPDLGAELAEEHPEEYGAAQFIFGDNLDQRRTAAIGLVMRKARALMPYWTTDQDIALRELRNFTMGVSEGRWPDDPARRDELTQLEATLARMSAIVTARDAKVEFLESASREELDAFDHEAGWPE